MLIPGVIVLLWLLIAVVPLSFWVRWQSESARAIGLKIWSYWHLEVAPDMREAKAYCLLFALGVSSTGQAGCRVFLLFWPRQLLKNDPGGNLYRLHYDWKSKVKGGSK